MPNVIDHNVVTMTAAIDPFSEEWTRTAEGVYSPDGVGLNWQVSVPVEYPQVAGAVEFGDVDTADEYMDSTYAGIGWVPNNIGTYPGLDKMALVGMDDEVLTLIKVRGAFALPSMLLQAQTLSAQAADLIRRNLLAAVRHFAMADLQSLYVEDTNKSIAAIASIAFSSSNRIMTFTPSSSTSFRFIRNAFYDVYDSTGTTKRNTGFKLMCKFVDHKLNTVTLADPSGANDLSAAGIVNTDIIVLRASKGKLPLGMNAFIKATGTVLGINVVSNPELKSWVRDLGGATLSNSVLLEVFGKYFKEYGPCRLIGAATPEIINKHLEEFDAVTAGASASQYKRQGEALDRRPGTKNVVLEVQYGTWTIPIYGAVAQQPQTVHFVNADPGNLMIYSPPTVDEFGQHADFPRIVQFVNSMYGGSIFGNALYTPPGGSAEVSDWSSAPCYAIYNRMMRKPAGIKLTTVGHLSNTWT